MATFLFVPVEGAGSLAAECSLCTVRCPPTSPSLPLSWLVKSVPAITLVLPRLVRV
ncbi:hypothetical protein E2C01_101756 [Portunus trituberculatus]|uniref:Uncharacterized protein n=1 Tax=Portunus trituberculatus TaxID=210409 RepID=A0A5B7KAM2_PORTR|nr:hypothetical protein [Portunus trituberculatus]